MARPLATTSLSLTAAGAALVSDATGSINPAAVEGLLVDDVRVVSHWHLDVVGFAAQLIGRESASPMADHLLFTLRTAGRIDPVALFERTRSVSGRGMEENIRLTAFVGPLHCTVRLSATRDDCTMYEIGEVSPFASPVSDINGRPASDEFWLPGPSASDEVVIWAPGWTPHNGELRHEVRLEAGATWDGHLRVAVPSESRPDEVDGAPVAAELASVPSNLGASITRSQADLAALTIPLDGRNVLGAGSPFFLALFGRDSLITGMQNLLSDSERLTDILGALASHQATHSDTTTGAQPGRILHELRVGRAGVFGVPPGTPYFGAVDTSALFVIALGEALRWGAPSDVIAALAPAARRALDWCRNYGDVDGDGFIESVPHATGLINLGWKDSGDSMLRTDGSTVVGAVALSEVQAYWYRALRSMAEIDQALGLGDGAADLVAADDLGRRFLDAFLFDSEGGPFVGLALDPDKQLLDVRTSNAGHVLWSGILPMAIGVRVAEQLAAPDLFSGWGVRTVSSTAPGYNPFGYHRGTVWPHDTGFALHGAARYGVSATVRALAGGLTRLEEACNGQLPELLSGIGAEAVSLPVPYTAACRPQAWAAGTSLVVGRALIGLEPDVPAGELLLRPDLPDGQEIRVTGLRLGSDHVSFTVRGREVVDVDSGSLRVLTGDRGLLAATSWCLTDAG
jgi:glycogen debranching enzyme